MNAFCIFDIIVWRVSKVVSIREERDDEMRRCTGCPGCLWRDTLYRLVGVVVLCVG